MLGKDYVTQLRDYHFPHTLKINLVRSILNTCFIWLVVAGDGDRGLGREGILNVAVSHGVFQVLGEVLLCHQEGAKIE